jgi:GH15 family glucan-1,4-alpha-glucosidase
VWRLAHGLQESIGMKKPVTQRTDGYLPISSYGLIGNCHTAALVGADGSVDFVCPERFDAPAVFCRLLDAEKGGFTSIAPTGEYSVERRYLEGTAVLETTFHRGDFTARLTDLLPIDKQEANEHGQDVQTSHELLRMVEGIEGEGELALRFKPTFDFASRDVRCTVNGGTATAGRGRSRVRLDCGDIGLHIGDDGVVEGTIQVQPGKKHWIVVSNGSRDDPLREETCSDLLRQTCDYWKQWSSSWSYDGPYKEHVLRSVITLKLLTYEPSGAVVAAPTTSLPEEIGGQRNWDYRFTWLRDSALILYALMSVGHEGEASDFMHWLHRTISADESSLPQIMYTIDGGTKLEEHLLDNLSGYCNSKPVRVGNGAATQTQLDIYGEVLLAADIHFCAGNSDEKMLHEMWPTLRHMANLAAERWRDHGAGIWEVRGGPRDFLYGKLFCWAALDRALHMADRFHLDAPIEEWKKEREAIRQAIHDRAYSDKLQAFTQSFDSDVLDSAALIIPRIGFLPATDPRVKSTVRAIRDHLTDNGLVYRYRSNDGLAGTEGTFTLCTYWLVDALALEGQLDEAHALFRKMLGYCNDLGLLSEEIDPRSGDLLGNFPQGFSHLALVQSAVNLSAAQKHGPEEESKSMGERARHGKQAAAEGHGSEHKGK